MPERRRQPLIYPDKNRTKALDRLLKQGSLNRIADVVDPSDGHLRQSDLDAAAERWQREHSYYVTIIPRDDDIEEIVIRHPRPGPKQIIAIHEDPHVEEQAVADMCVEFVDDALGPPGGNHALLIDREIHLLRTGRSARVASERAAARSLAKIGMAPRRRDPRVSRQSGWAPVDPGEPPSFTTSAQYRACHAMLQDIYDRIRTERNAALADGEMPTAELVKRYSRLVFYLSGHNAFASRSPYVHLHAPNKRRGVAAGKLLERVMRAVGLPIRSIIPDATLPQRYPGTTVIFTPDSGPDRVAAGSRGVRSSDIDNAVKLEKQYLPERERCLFAAAFETPTVLIDVKKDVTDQQLRDALVELDTINAPTQRLHRPFNNGRWLDEEGVEKMLPNRFMQLVRLLGFSLEKLDFRKYSETTKSLENLDRYFTGLDDWGDWAASNPVPVDADISLYDDMTRDELEMQFTSVVSQAHFQLRDLAGTLYDDFNPAIKLMGLMTRSGLPGIPWSEASNEANEFIKQSATVWYPLVDIYPLAKSDRVFHQWSLTEALYEFAAWGYKIDTNLTNFDVFDDNDLNISI